MLSVDSKVIGIAIEHRNPINQSADFVVWKEGKTRVYRNGEISRGSAVLLKLFMLDRDYMSTGEDLHFLFRVCK